MELLTSRVLLQPRDLPRSLAFYEQTLELAIYREWDAGGHRSVAFFLGGGGILEVSGSSEEPPSSAIKLVLQVRDVVTTRERLVVAGVAICAEPELKPWGLLEMSALDPDGLELIFIEVPPGHPRRGG